jgi:hypothetical protein
MIVALDLDVIKRSKLTVEKFFFCYLLSQRKFSELGDYVRECGSFNKGMVIELINQGYISYPLVIDKEDIDAFKLKTTDKFNSLVFSNNDLLFERFWQTFPSKAEDDTPLRTEKPVCKRLFLDIIKSNPVQLANHITACLEIEVMGRRKRGDLKFMKRSPAWLRGNYWEPQEELLEKYKEWQEKQKTQTPSQINSFND